MDIEDWPGVARVRERSPARRWQIDGSPRLENGFRSSVMVLLGVRDFKYREEAKALFVSPICKTEREANEWAPSADVVGEVVERKKSEWPNRARPAQHNSHETEIPCLRN